MSMPIDRGHLVTEQKHPMTDELDTLSTKACVDLLAIDHIQAVDAVTKASNDIASFIESLAIRGGRLIYIGCGTSGRLGVLDAAECPPTFQSNPNQIVGLIAGGDASLKTSSESKEDNFEGSYTTLKQLKLTSRDTVLGIAAGGTTPWVHGGLAFAKKKGAMTGLVTCANEPFEYDHLIFLDTGPEPLTGSTRMKAGTATKLTLNIITTTLFIKLGKVYGNLMVDLKASNAKLKDRAIRIIIQSCLVNRKEAAKQLEEAGNDVKIAILMHKKNINQQEAKQLLNNAKGYLRAAL